MIWVIITETWYYLGASNILAMQRAFFAGFREMRWVTNAVQEIRPGVVLFDFVFSGTTHDGEEVHRPGSEYVIIHEGKIQHVEVRNKD